MSTLSHSISIGHIDYLQRTHIDLIRQSIEPSPTQAPPALRRLWHITEVGRIQKQPPALNEQQPGIPIRLPSEDIITGAFGYKIKLAFLVWGRPEHVAVHVGNWTTLNRENVPAQDLDFCQEILKSVLQSLHPALTAVPASADLRDLSLAGLALGMPTIKPSDPTDGAVALDRLIRAMSGTNWAYLVLAEPLADDVTRGQRNRIIEEMRTVQAAGESAQAPLPLLEHYTELLQTALKAYSLGLSVGMWRTAVYLLGDRLSYHRLASLWRGIHAGDESLPEPITIWNTASILKLATNWALPEANLNSAPPGRFKHLSAFQTLLTSKQLSAYMHLPEIETSGFAVNTIPAFDTVPPAIGDDTPIDLGQVILGTQPIARSYALPRNDLTRHVFIAGVTGAGKTHTIFCLLKQAQRTGVPFLVIEPAKTEYRSLLNDGQLSGQLQVFTLGDERISPFRLNPFEVLPGVPVGVHLDLLRSVFSASMGMWTPLPQVLEQCLHAIYIERGWDIAHNTNHRLDPEAEPWMAFPTLSDLIAKVDEVTRQLGYEERVTSDIRAALLTRLNALRAGGKGHMLDVRRSLPMSLLLKHPTILELEGLGDDDDKAFVMGLLLIRLVESRRIEAKADGLRHLLVIEEAHRLLANVSPQSRQEEANPRGKAVETFANLLAEIRAYGQGVIVADQVPVKLAPDVIKNTNLKIAHRVVAADDREALAGAMAMNEQQTHSLAILTRGRAAIFSEGDDAPVLIQIPPPEKNSENTKSVEDSILIKYIHRSNTLNAHHDLFHRLPACTETCQRSAQACELASRIVEEAGFQRLFARLVLSIMSDTDALDRLWPELVAVVRSLCPPHIAELQLLHSLATHAADWFAQKRGAQAGWSYSATDALARALRQMLLAKLNPEEPVSGRHEFQQVALTNHARVSDPFPACGRICQQAPPICLYRYAAADLINQGEFNAGWQFSLAEDARSENGGQKNLWEACVEASFSLVEFPESDSPAETRDAVYKAARRVSLCVGQQLLTQDLTRMPRTAARMMDELLIKGSTS